LEIKKVLLISYHFPPISGSSGYLRALKFATYLPDFGYTPIILTANPASYDDLDERMLEKLPGNLNIRRAFAFNLKKHLSIFGKYPGFIALPDQFASWIPFAVMQGIKLIKKNRIDLIFSTYPVASAHLAGLILNKMTKVPWIVDFRDPMWDDYSVFGSSQMRVRKFIEKKAVQNADYIICTTDSIRRLILERFDTLSKNRITTIPNGYDENDFTNVNFNVGQTGPIKFIHTGLLERIDRDPFPFFEGVKLFIKNEHANGANFHIEFYGSGSENMYREKVTALELQDIIKIRERIPYGEILNAMVAADALLLFQGPTCNTQIPAKFYEYLRIGKPILALTTSNGETGKLVSQTNSGEVVDIENPEAIANKLEEWYQKVRKKKALPSAAKNVAEKYSRRAQTSDLAKCFDLVLQS